MWGLYSLFKYWKFIVILLLTSGIGFGMWQLERKNKKIYELELMMQEKVFYLESLEDAVDLQNSMIDDMEDKTKEFEDALKKSNKKIIVIETREKKKILAILEARSGNTCEENMDWMVDIVKDGIRWEN